MVLEKALVSGNTHNKYALQNKIKSLKRKLRRTSQATSWNNFLAK